MKKQFLYINILFFVLLIQSCHTTRIVPYNAMVTSVSNENLTSGLIHLRSTGKGVKAEEAISDAEKNAFNALLFTGIPGSAQERPMIADEASAKAENTAFFQSFFNRKGYRNFITSITNNGFLKGADGERMTTINVVINLAALRINLENNNIIRKFGL